ncbi:hypothetical protein ACFL96_04075 [Thermoproteota archaeon]
MSDIKWVEASIEELVRDNIITDPGHPEYTPEIGKGPKVYRMTDFPGPKYNITGLEDAMPILLLYLHEEDKVSFGSFTYNGPGVHAHCNSSNADWLMGKEVKQKWHSYDTFFKAFGQMGITFDEFLESLNGLPLSEARRENAKGAVQHMMCAVPRKAVEKYVKDPVEFYEIVNG